MSTRILVVAAVLFALVATVGAENPNQAFNGRIIVSSKRFPQSAKSPSAYTAAIRKLSQTNFYEDKTDHTWVIWCAGFLKAPLPDVEYTVKIYELTGKTQQFLSAVDQFADSSGQRTITTKLKLEKKQFGVNKALMFTIESKGKMLASSGMIKILGEGDRFSGKVEFSEDEANGKDKDE